MTAETGLAGLAGRMRGSGPLTLLAWGQMTPAVTTVLSNLRRYTARPINVVQQAAFPDGTSNTIMIAERLPSCAGWASFTCPDAPLETLRRPRFTQPDVEQAFQDAVRTSEYVVLGPRGTPGRSNVFAVWTTVGSPAGPNRFRMFSIVDRTQLLPGSGPRLTAGAAPPVLLGLLLPAVQGPPHER